MRIYLPHGGPVIQELVPLNAPSTARPHTLQTVLQQLLPALFPPRQAPGAHSMTSSFITHQKQLVNKVIIQGIDVPLDAELGWCAACLAYPDGWLGIVLAF
jgi:autophagy-related protein 5